jgi:pyridoxine 5-phosphate synthase
MHKRGVLVSAFIVPDKEQIIASARYGCDAIELHTGQYANAETEKDIRRQLDRLEAARDYAFKKRLIVHAGHGLTYRNIGPIAALAGLSELNIGHSIIARSMFVGIREATAEMIRLIEKHLHK